MKRIGIMLFAVGFLHFVACTPSEEEQKQIEKEALENINRVLEEMNNTELDKTEKPLLETDTSRTVGAESEGKLDVDSENGDQNRD